MWLIFAFEIYGKDFENFYEIIVLYSPFTSHLTFQRIGVVVSQKRKGYKNSGHFETYGVDFETYGRINV